MFTEVKENLFFDEPTELYVSNNPDNNAYALSRLDEDDVHIININSGLVEKMDDDELKFVIGHEIGHLASKNAEISRIIEFVFPGNNNIPYLLFHKIKLWEKLSELTADRFGFMAISNLEKCISSFIKLASGMDLNKLKIDFQEYLKENDRVLEYFRKNFSANLLTHPVNPIRIKAIDLFFQSDLYQQVIDGKEILNDAKLDEEFDNLIRILTYVSNSELDYYRQYFLASAGLLLGQVDEELNELEINNILSKLSIFCMYPEELLLEIIRSKKVEDIFMESVKNILEINPSEKYNMFDFCVDLTIADRKLNKEEVDILYSIGKTLFQFSEKETAQLIAEKLRKQFVPKLYQTSLIMSALRK